LIEQKASTSVNYELGESEEILTLGAIVFSLDGKLVSYSPDINSHTVSVRTHADLSTLKATLDAEIKHRNPLRRKNLALQTIHGELSATIKPTPATTFADVIVPQDLKEDIYDNTIYHLKNLALPTGVIMHGAPGTGKSLICSAIIQEALKEGFNACYISSYVDFDVLEELIENFLTPCVVVFEDVDSFGFSREDYGINKELSKFLQFINGISERTDPIVFVATTNYLDKLDAAIANRPVRFNRKFEFKLPTDSEIDSLMEIYFKTDEFKGLCHKKKFTGAHIREIKRTADIQILKCGGKYKDVINSAISAVSQNFSVTIKESVGFKNA
jgi:SpoVK/Ycf46/Vps4 family AAA+-type ATPase